jgi:uncharacterized protein (UPF0297 family)
MLVTSGAGLKRSDSAQNARMSTEPGLDRHEWEGEFQALEPELEDAPREALPELLGLVDRMLDERGYAPNDPVAGDGGDEPEILAEYRAARETANAVERGGDDVGPGDVAAAVNGLRAVFDHLVSERQAP